jgi:hypothetical protein
MADRPKHIDEGRQKLLEEIRRRSELAEMRRIEEEDQERPDAQGEPPREEPPLPAAEAARPTHPVEPPNNVFPLESASNGEKQIADQTVSPTPAPPQAEEVPPPPPEPGSPPVENEPPSQAEANELAGMVEQAEARYQHEQYDEALRLATIVLERDPGNQSALNIKERIEKAKALLARIAEEDAASRGGENTSVSPATSFAAEPKPRDVDVWGSHVVPMNPLGLDEMPEVRGPMVPPKPSME